MLIALRLGHRNQASESGRFLQYSSAVRSCMHALQSMESASQHPRSRFLSKAICFCSALISAGEMKLYFLFPNCLEINFEKFTELNYQQGSFMSKQAM